jgi:hypothetical protein
MKNKHGGSDRDSDLDVESATNILESKENGNNEVRK